MIRDTFLNAANRVDDVSAVGALQSIPAARAALGDRLGGPDALVTRALAILDQDTVRTDARYSRLANIAREFAPQPGGTGPSPTTDLQLQRRVLCDGSECFLPIRYFDVQCLVASFLVAPEAAYELLGGAGLQVVLQEDGKAIVDLFCIDYRETDIGPYNEVGLTVRAKAPGDPIAANYVAHLPVTSAVANRAGREIWGYNKFVAAIDISSNGKTFSTVLRDSDGGLIGALQGVRGASVPTPATDILTFTVHQGRLLKTVIKVLTPSLASSGESFLFKVGMSRHPMATNLCAIGLDGARPVLTTYAEPFQALLFPGRPV